MAQTGALFDDFLFWNFSGNAGQGGGDDSEDLEGARWRSSAFLAIDGNDVVFKAAQGYVDGLQGKTGGSSGLFGAFDVSDDFFDDQLFTILKTGMAGDLVDLNAANMNITALGIERDGFRNGRLAINASFEGIDPTDPTKTVGWAGIYVAQVPEPPSYALMLLALGLAGAVSLRRRVG